MTKIEINDEILSESDLERVVGGLNPQPLPPAPPPPQSFSHNPFATHFNFGRFAFERVNFFNFI